MSDLTFYLDRYSAEMPARIHSRETDNGGNPQWHHAFERYITDGGNAKAFLQEAAICQHPTVESGHCPTCDDTGLRQHDRLLYVYPAKRALRQLRDVYVRKGQPPLDVLLRALAANGGDIGMTAQALRPRYSYCWSRENTARLVDYALREFRLRYIEEAPGRVIDKSESQSIAEAA